MRRRHQTTGPPPSTISRLISVDRLHGLLQFGADPFALKNKYPWFLCGCKETTSPDEGTKGKCIQPPDECGQAALPPTVWGSSVGLEKTSFLRFGVVAKLPHYQTKGPPPSTFSQLMSLDRLHGLLKFGADPFVLIKTKF